MKKLIDRLRKRKDLPPSSRITSETVAEHREHILAGGRKFKYPIQYVRHKLVINTIIISVLTVIVAIVIGWWQLYPMQNTSEFMYRVTTVIPVPVAVVDGQPVLYSDYLMKYLSSVHYLEQKMQINTSTDDGKRQIEYVKQQSMQYVIYDAYAAKLAKKLGISVSDTELSDFLKERRKTSNGEVSEQTNNAVILDYYGWSPEEYRHMAKNMLLSQKVAYSMDKDALSTIHKVADAVSKGTNISFSKLATSISKQTGTTVNYGTSGWVPKFNQDGGLSIEAVKLKIKGVSSVVRSSTGKGYYILRLLDINDSQVKYEYIQVPLTAFAKSLEKIEKDHKVTRYISVPELSDQAQTN